MNHTVFATSILLCLAAAPVAYSAESNVAQDIIARERASFVAWQKKDRAFFEDYLTDDATYFGPTSPYRADEPKSNFLPKFDQYVEAHKILDFNIINPQVQVYGDAAVLTYYEDITSNDGGKVSNYTGKATSVYVKQKGVWRAVHGHESVNASGH
jgi:ketosteroid isomerase-like protein